MNKKMKSTKWLFVFLFLPFLSTVAFSQEKYVRLKVFTGKESLQEIAALGVTLEGNFIGEDGFLVLEISKKEVKILMYY